MYSQIGGSNFLLGLVIDFGCNYRQKHVPMARGHPVPTFPRFAGKGIHVFPSLARSVGEGQG